MLERQKRLNEVYEHLHNYCNVHTKGDFADKISYARAYISSALNGNEKYLTDKLFMKICEVYEIFNLDYLLTGKGKLLKSDQAFDDMERALKDAQKTIDGFDAPRQQIDQSSLVNAALAAKDETIASQRETIESLKRENALLRQQLSKYQGEDVLRKFPFTPGVADSKDNNPAHV
jgi:hypothetical protein